MGLCVVFRVLWWELKFSPYSSLSFFWSVCGLIFYFLKMFYDFFYMYQFFKKLLFLNTPQNALMAILVRLFILLLVFVVWCPLVMYHTLQPCTREVIKSMFSVLTLSVISEWIIKSFYHIFHILSCCCYVFSRGENWVCCQNSGRGVFSIDFDLFLWGFSLI